MNLSSRWCVTAVVALGAIACSDPVPPAAQGAIWVRIQSASPTPTGKSCPSGASTTFDVPHVDPNMKNDKGEIVDEVLDENTYLHWIIDGQSSSSVSCSVSGGSGGYSFSGRLKGPTTSSTGKTGIGSIEISSGTLDGTSKKGTATMTIADSADLSQSMASPSAACTVEAVPGDKTLQPGSMWASFTCSSIESPPADYCTAHGILVLENCSQ